MYSHFYSCYHYVFLWESLGIEKRGEGKNRRGDKYKNCIRSNVFVGGNHIRNLNINCRDARPWVCFRSFSFFPFGRAWVCWVLRSFGEKMYQREKTASGRTCGVNWLSASWLATRVLILTTAVRSQKTGQVHFFSWRMSRLLFSACFTNGILIDTENPLPGTKLGEKLDLLLSDFRHLVVGIIRPQNKSDNTWF